MMPLGALQGANGVLLIAVSGFPPWRAWTAREESLPVCYLVILGMCHMVQKDGRGSGLAMALFLLAALQDIIQNVTDILTRLVRLLLCSSWP